MKEQKESEEIFEEGSYIAVGDIIVHSVTASLKEVEETINRLIEKHKQFVLGNRESRLFGSVGVG